MASDRRRTYIDVLNLLKNELTINWEILKSKCNFFHFIKTFKTHLS